MEWFVPSDFCACPTKAKGDEEHGEEERKIYTSYTYKCKIIVAGIMSDKKKLLFVGFDMTFDRYVNLGMLLAI